MRNRLLNGILIVIQTALLAAVVSTWWTHRSNTLFHNGRWIVGKDTGKYVFYAHDFLFQPLTGAGVDLTGCMGFQEILYARPEDEDRQLAGIECNAAVNGGGIRQSLELYRGLLRGFEPDLLIAGFGLNENTGLHRLGADDQIRLHTGLQAGFLDELIRACQADGVGFVHVLEPMCSETPFQRIQSFYDALADTARKHGFPVLDPEPLVREKEAEHLVWWDSAHFAPYGQRLMAEFLEDAAAARVGRASPPDEP